MGLLGAPQAKLALSPANTRKLSLREARQTAKKPVQSTGFFAV